ncbi:UNVERIFIED_CONTAM: hypothetical protein K2H54_043642 [Gekko kuhli]
MASPHWCWPLLHSAGANLVMKEQRSSPSQKNHSQTKLGCCIKMARITLEELNEMDDEDLDEDEEPMDREEQNRLFSHWEAVATTHQVTLPQDMVGPIVQMTQHNQTREPAPYTTLSQHDKVNYMRETVSLN